jgi:chromosomal replication initiator protein
MNSSNIWDDILARIQAKVNRHSFYTWFKPTAFIADDGRNLSVRVPNSLFKDWITKHYSGVIGESADRSEARGRGGQFHRVAAGRRRDALVAPARDHAGHDSAAHHVGGWLNPRYTFDTFIVGTFEPVRATRPAARWPKRRHAPTTRSSSTGAWGSVRRI